MRAQWAAITFEMPFGTVAEHLRYLVLLSEGTSAARSTTKVTPRRRAPPKSETLCFEASHLMHKRLPKSQKAREVLAGNLDLDPSTAWLPELSEPIKSAIRGITEGATAEKQE